MAAMHNAPVHTDGTTLAYIDSGSPPDHTYTTIVLVHGLGYTAQIFLRLLQFAPSRNLRVIAIARRDYVNSTPLSASDLALLFSDKPADHEQFLHARGLEIARFLTWVIDELKIPPARDSTEGGHSGGIALVGWSLGAATTLAFLRYLPSFPEELIQKLDPYLKTFIIHDSSYTTLGYPHPQGMYHPMRDPAIAVEERWTAFSSWISSYFSHPYYISPSAPSTASRTLERLALRMPDLDSRSGLEDTVIRDGEARPVFKAASYANIEPEAFAASFDIGCERSETVFRRVVRSETLHDLLSGAVFFSTSASDYSAPSAAMEPSTVQPASVQRRSVLPELRVLYLYGTHSPWTTQWSVWTLEADLAAHPESTRRPVELVRVEGANHFLHWDDPEAYLTIIAEKCGVRSQSGST